MGFHCCIWTRGACVSRTSFLSCIEKDNVVAAQAASSTSLVATVPVRIISLRTVQRERLVLYTDATGAGNLAWSADLRGERTYARAVVPRWLRRWACHRQNQIATWELCAAVCGLWNFVGDCALPPHLEVHMFIDNTVALGTVLRGASRQEDWNMLVSDIWLQTAKRGILLLCWHVPSKQNVADAPTRPDQQVARLQQMHQAGFREIPWCWPSYGPWGTNAVAEWT